MRPIPFLRLALAAAALTASTLAAAAFPDKPIRVVVGFPAGGPLDQHARLLSDKLQVVLGQPVLIDYKSGAGGTVGAQEVMKAPPDGYTLMLANTGVMVINPALYSKLPYATLRDFTPVARTAMQPLALLVNPKVPAASLKDLHIRCETDGQEVAVDPIVPLDMLVGGGEQVPVLFARRAFGPGRHAFLITAKDHMPARCDVEVAADKASEVEVELQPVAK